MREKGRKGGRERRREEGRKGGREGGRERRREGGREYSSSCCVSSAASTSVVHLIIVEVGHEKENRVALLPSAIGWGLREEGVQLLGKSLNYVCTWGRKRGREEGRERGREEGKEGGREGGRDGEWEGKEGRKECER